MDADNYTQEYHFLSMESLSVPPADSSPNPASFPSQGTPILDWGWSDPLFLDTPNPEIDAQASILVGCDAPLYCLLMPGPMFRHSPLVSVHHYMISMTATYRPQVLWKRTICVRQ
jgi:hypothetical protein